MDHRYLGRTGLKVSELCLGAMSFGAATDEPASHRILDRFTEAGGDFIDTADVYNEGASESIVGRWLEGRRRDDLVIATKAFGDTGTAANDGGAGRKHLRSAVEASLRRLRTDYIDLYQIHVFDDATPIEETLSTLDDLVRSGKVRFLGASNYAAWQLQKSIDTAHLHGWEPFACLQPLYNLIDRETEWDLIPVCRSEGVGVIPWSPLRGGWLAGRYRRGMDAPPPGSRAEARAKDEPWDADADERTWRVIDAVHAVAEESGRTPAQVALRWLMEQPGVTAPILGPRTLEHLEENLAAADAPLDAGHAARLTEASDRPKPYPYNVLDRFHRR